MKGLADQIVANAKREATLEAEKAKAALKLSIERRLKADKDQIASAEGDAVRAVRDRALAQTAMAAATEILGKQASAADRSAGIDKAIEDVANRLN